MISTTSGGAATFAPKPFSKEDKYQRSRFSDKSNQSEQVEIGLYSNICSFSVNFNPKTQGKWRNSSIIFQKETWFISLYQDLLWSLFKRMKICSSEIYPVCLFQFWFLKNSWTTDLTRPSSSRQAIFSSILDVQCTGILGCTWAIYLPKPN